MTAKRLMEDLRSLLRMLRLTCALFSELGPLCIGKRAEAWISGHLKWTGFSLAGPNPDRALGTWPSSKGV